MTYLETIRGVEVIWGYIAN